MGARRRVITGDTWMLSRGTQEDLWRRAAGPAPYADAVLRIYDALVAVAIAVHTHDTALHDGDPIRLECI